MSDDAAQTVLSAFEPALTLPLDEFQYYGISSLYFPRFSQETLENLSREASSVLSRDPAVLKLEGNFYIFGDIHGNIRDLIRLLVFTKKPFNGRFIFLGDYVDRGEFSLEVIAVLLAMKIKRPNDVFLLRGNHEFRELCTNYGFRQQIMMTYDKELFESFCSVFQHLPIAGILNNDTLLVHGGISPNLTIEKIMALSKQGDNFEETEEGMMICDMIWSDPTKDEEIEFSPSPRGYGYLFGRIAFERFLEATGFSRVIRGHQCVKDGVESSFDGKLYTVFSSSNYDDDKENKCGLIYINRYNVSVYGLAPIPRVLASECIYRNIAAKGGIIQVPQRTLKSTLLLTSTTSTSQTQRKLLRHGSGARIPLSAVKSPLKRRESLNGISLALNDDICSTLPSLRRSSAIVE